MPVQLYNALPSPRPDPDTRMGTVCGKSSQAVEPEDVEEISSGDLVLMRLACVDSDGLEIPVDVMRYCGHPPLTRDIESCPQQP